MSSIRTSFSFFIHTWVGEWVGGYVYLFPCWMAAWWFSLLVLWVALYASAFSFSSSSFSLCCCSRERMWAWAWV